jgi:hypothetical protein
MNRIETVHLVCGNVNAQTAASSRSSAWEKLMNIQPDKLLSTSWNTVRNAGSAVSDAAVNSRVGTSLAKNLPRMKEMVSLGAGLALAQRGTRVAVKAVRRHPVAAIAGAVALAGLGFALAVASRRRREREEGASPRSSRSLVAKNMRSNGGKRAVATKAAPRAPRVRKAKESTTAH